MKMNQFRSLWQQDQKSQEQPNGKRSRRELIRRIWDRLNGITNCRESKKNRNKWNIEQVKDFKPFQ